QVSSVERQVGRRRGIPEQRVRLRIVRDERKEIVRGNHRGTRGNLSDQRGHMAVDRAGGVAERVTTFARSQKVTWVQGRKRNIASNEKNDRSCQRHLTDSATGLRRESEPCRTYCRSRAAVRRAPESDALGQRPQPDGDAEPLSRMSGS